MYRYRKHANTYNKEQYKSRGVYCYFCVKSGKPPTKDFEQTMLSFKGLKLAPMLYIGHFKFGVRLLFA